MVLNKIIDVRNVRNPHLRLVVRLPDVRLRDAVDGRPMTHKFLAAKLGANGREQFPEAAGWIFEYVSTRIARIWKPKRNRTIVRRAAETVVHESGAHWLKNIEMRGTMRFNAGKKTIATKQAQKHTMPDPGTGTAPGATLVASFLEGAIAVIFQ
ncbi:hypothetical protein BC828DRAFT_46302 [Blastocladiella britannica]|nr:hypothetical protein BC828DRAFT_46302 [Blastocladiella britannica]